MSLREAFTLSQIQALVLLTRAHPIPISSLGTTLLSVRLPPTPSHIVPPTLPRQAVAFLSLSGHPIRGHSPHSSLSSILASVKFSSYLMPEARGTRAPPGGAGCWGFLSLTDTSLF